MPESMSVERRRIISAYGAEFDLTPREKGMKGSIERAKELAASTPGAGIPQQFENPSNPDTHYRTTGQEIWEQMEGRVDGVALAAGSGGTFTGVVRRLKELYGSAVHVTVLSGRADEETRRAAVDARALMLASLAARRCAETPELASNLEQQKTAAEAWTVLEAALGCFNAPLCTVTVGVLVLHERLRRAQKVALTLAVAGAAGPRGRRHPPPPVSRGLPSAFRWRKATHAWCISSPNTRPPARSSAPTTTARRGRW